jgi:hypothetical protein
VISRDNVLVADTRSMEWEQAPDRKLYKTLEFDEFGYPCLMVMNIAPRDPSKPRSGVPFRHVHADAFENSFMLAGELPHAEYETEDEHNAEVYLKRPGVFMRRQPGSIHGAEADIWSRTGATLLYWRSPGGGTNTGEVNYDERSPHLPIDQSRRTGRGFTMVETGPGGVIFDRPDFSAYDTVLMDWEEIPPSPGAYWKVLERAPDGAPLIFLLSVPAGSTQPRHSHRTVHERFFVLEGELHLREYDNEEDTEGIPVILREGCFAWHMPGSVHGRPDPSPVGATLLFWRTGGGTFPSEDGFAEESLLPA